MKQDPNDLLDIIEDIPKGMRLEYIESYIGQHSNSEYCIFCGDKMQNTIICSHCKNKLINL